MSGSPDALTLCIGQICNIMLENPPRGPNIPYKPHTLPNQAYQPRVSGHVLRNVIMCMCCVCVLYGDVHVLCVCVVW